MYRIVTLAMVRAGVDLADPAAIEAAADVPLSVSYDPDVEQSFLDGEDVSVQIRGDEVTRAVSAVSAATAATAASAADSRSWVTLRRFRHTASVRRPAVAAVQVAT